MASLFKVLTAATVLVAVVSAQYGPGPRPMPYGRVPPMPLMGGFGGSPLGGSGMMSSFPSGGYGGVPPTPSYVPQQPGRGLYPMPTPSYATPGAGFGSSQPGYSRFPGMPPMPYPGQSSYPPVVPPQPGYGPTPPSPFPTPSQYGGSVPPMPFPTPSQYSMPSQYGTPNPPQYGNMPPTPFVPDVPSYGVPSTPQQPTPGYDAQSSGASSVAMSASADGSSFGSSGYSTPGGNSY